MSEVLSSNPYRSELKDLQLRGLQRCRWWFVGQLRSWPGSRWRGFDSSVTGIAAQSLVLAGADGSRERSQVPDLVLVDADAGLAVPAELGQYRLWPRCVQSRYRPGLIEGFLAKTGLDLTLP